MTTRPWVPSVLIEKGKHGDFYYDATTLEAFQANAWAILKERWDAGYYYYKPEKPEYTGLPVEDIKALKDKDTELYKAAVTKWNRFKNENTYYLQDKAFWDKLERVIKNEEKAAAWVILDERGDHEYERIDLESLRMA